MLVLASSSPRRQELLRNAGIDFTVQAAHIRETPLPGELARDCAKRLALDKAIAVWRKRPRDLILGADTIVVVDGAMLGKPRDAADATRMLRRLSGGVHQVITGVCLIGPMTGEARALIDKRSRLKRKTASPEPPANISKVKISSKTTRVTMVEISDEEIQAYVATGEPMDKAGAYAIQGMASRWIPRIEGDYSNVVGLPVALVYGMLQWFKTGRVRKAGLRE
jgi:septum formation protein